MLIGVLQSHHGGFAIGASLFGRGLWVQREPHCHRWSVWRMRAASAPTSDGPPWEGDTGLGVREPRRPRPGAGGAQAALEPPDT